MDSLRIQQQIRDNAEEAQEYANSLKDWEQEMKKKDEELLTSTTADQSTKTNHSVDERILKHEEADTHKMKGNNFVKIGKWKEALKEYSKSISLYQDDAIYYGNRSYCYMQLKNLEAAENDCDRALELKPNYGKVALRRANLRRIRGDIVGAAKDYNLTLLLEPKHTVALKEYEEIYPELQKHYAELGINLPDFLDANPSLKPPQDDEPKLNINVGRKKTKSQPSTVSQKNDTLKEQNCSPRKNYKNKESTARNLGDYIIIKPINNKPPHLRSKLPLRRINIEDVYLNSEDDFADFF